MTTGNIRSLAEPKIAASLRANSGPTLEELAGVPTAVETTKGYTLPLICSRTGITIGSLNIATVAGHMPMIGQWRDSMILHPLFSLHPGALHSFAKNTWFRYCNFSTEETENDKLVEKQELMIRIASVALIHQMTEVRQDIHWLPEFSDVASHWSSLMALSYWKHYLDSARFRFPSLHISKLEPAPSIKDYLQTCWSVKKSYETTVNEKIEVEKLRAAEAAAIALRDMLAGARPTSNRQLWRWFVAHMPKRYSKDLEGWMAAIFFAKGEEIREFTIRDIDLLEEYFLCECPVGTSISHAFSEVLSSKRAYLQQHFEAFEIVIPKEIEQAKEAGNIPEKQPVASDFATRGAYLVATARWKLAHTDMLKNIATATARQQQQTVKTSTAPPKFVLREYETDDDQLEEVGGILDALNEQQEQDHITGELEDE